MLHAKFEDHVTKFWSRRYINVLPYGHGGYLGHVIKTIFSSTESLGSQGEFIVYP